MSEEKKEIANLSTPIEELEYKLMTETDLEEVKNVINLFNLNIQKKNILRTGKLNDLQDKIYDQISKRVDMHPDEFSNKDLLDYFKTIQDTISKTDNTLNKVDTPAIQINQNQLNLKLETEDALDQASKRRVMEAVRNILKKAETNDLTNLETSDIIDGDYTEVQEDN